MEEFNRGQQTEYNNTTIKKSKMRKPCVDLEIVFHRTLESPKYADIKIDMLTAFSF